MATWTVGEFNPALDDWTSYAERVEFYFEANGVTDASKKRARLLSSCGAQTYKLIRNLTAPSTPMEMTYKDIVKRVHDHYQPKTSTAVERLKFHSRVRKSNESVATFICQLRELSQFCDFGENLEEMLKDRLICGIGDTRMQRRLLSEKDLTFQKAQDIVLALEAADANAGEVETTIQPPQPQINSLYKGPVSKSRSTRAPPPCYRCGGSHSHRECRFQDSTCHYCHKRGHIAKVCKSKLRKFKPTTARNHLVEQKSATDPSHMENSTYSMFNLSSNPQICPWLVTLHLNKHPVKMQIDTGATTTIMSKSTFSSLWQTPPPLANCSLTLKTYTGELIPVVGEASVLVSYRGQSKQLPLVVVDGAGPPLLGRDWLQHLKLDWHEVNALSTMPTQLSSLLQKHSSAFLPGLGTFSGPPVDIQIASDAKPKFYKARSVPFMLKEKIEEELDRLVSEKVIEPVKSSKWAAPIVPVVKQDGKIRICGDYKLTANPVSELNAYPLPKIEELFTALAGGKMFSKLDLSHAYLQLPLEEASKPLTTINTHKGLFQYNRMPFGISSAPAVFQKTMDTLLKGMKHVTAYIDDIVVTGATEEEHTANLNEVLSRLEAAGLRLKREKCRFLMPQVEYLGHLIGKEGLRPNPSKVKAILDAPIPSNVSELRSFLGLVNYYAKFIPNLSSTLSPLYSLLQDSQQWTWGDLEQEHFLKAKQLLTSPRLLVHFDPTKDLVLSCDASQYGIGAVLAHRSEKGTEQPISYASRTLSPAEKKYSQIDKEALAIIFGVTKFHQYLFGREFTIITDHKPLTHLFHPKKSVPQMASARLQRWALTLGAYSYSLQYRPGKENANADALSRLPLPSLPPVVPTPGDIILTMSAIEESPVCASDIRRWTAKDPILSKVLRYVTRGWPHLVTEVEISPFFRRRHELSVEDGCILWGARVVIPQPGRMQLLKELHETHSGITKMKALARGFIWWPGIDADLENEVKQCTVCQLHQNNPPLAPIHSWQWPANPWSRLHVDFAGPFMGRMFLIIIDAHSKWIDAHMMSSCTTQSTIDKLRNTFAVFGLPRVIVSDNGPSFTSTEFKVFMRENGIIHRTTAPYHPSSNGLAERAVQTLKSGLKKLSGPMEARLSKFLFSYRTTPQATTGVSPAQLMFGRPLRTRLDLVLPDVAKRVCQRQMRMEDTRATSSIRSFDVGDPVLCRDFGPAKTKWISATILRKTGPLSYEVILPDGRVWRRHVDQLILRHQKPISDVFDSNPQTSDSDIGFQEDPPVLRRSTRIQRNPDRFNPCQ